MRELSVEGMVIRVGSNAFHLKVHLVGSFGDIPSVSEINHLSGHNSYWPCRFCTIRPCKVGCLGQAANDQNDPCRERTLEDFLFGDAIHGVKNPSIFKKLPSFSSPIFMGIDIYHLLDLNIAKQLKSFLERKGCSLHLKHTYRQNIRIMIEVQTSSMPDIFDGEFKNVLLPSQRLRGVDWSVFIQFILPTLVVEQIELQQFNRVPKKKLDESSVNDCVLALFATPKIVGVCFSEINR